MSTQTPHADALDTALQAGSASTPVEGYISENAELLTLAEFEEYESQCKQLVAASKRLEDLYLKIRNKADMMSKEGRDQQSANDQELTTLEADVHEGSLDPHSPAIVTQLRESAAKDKERITGLESQVKALTLAYEKEKLKTSADKKQREKPIKGQSKKLQKAKKRVLDLEIANKHNLAELEKRSENFGQVVEDRRLAIHNLDVLQEELRKCQLDWTVLREMITALEGNRRSIVVSLKMHRKHLYGFVRYVFWTLSGLPSFSFQTTGLVFSHM